MADALGEVRANFAMGQWLTLASSQGGQFLAGAQLAQCVLALKEDNTRLQQKVQELERNLADALQDVRTLQTEKMQLELCCRQVMSIAGSRQSTSLLDGLDKLTSLRPPPGLELVEDGSLPSTEISPRSSASHSGEESLSASFSGFPTVPGLEDGDLGRRIEWRIENVFSKLRVSCGYPLISHAFAAGPLSNVRLMFVPGMCWASDVNRKLKKRPFAPVNGGPPNGAIKLKAPSVEGMKSVRFYLTVGSVRQGPCVCSFAEQTVQGFDLEMDWQEHVEKKGNCLNVSLEFC